MVGPVQAQAVVVEDVVVLLDWNSGGLISCPVQAYCKVIVQRTLGQFSIPVVVARFSISVASQAEGLAS